MRRPFPPLLLALALAGCASVDAPVEDRSREELVRPAVPTTQPEHVVERGDTLYGIAFRHGLDVAQLARWNDLHAPFTIYPGQRLRLSRDARQAPPPAPPREPAPLPREHDDGLNEELDDGRDDGVVTSPVRDGEAVTATMPLRDAEPLPEREPPRQAPPPPSAPPSRLADVVRPSPPREPVTSAPEVRTVNAMPAPPRADTAAPPPRVESETAPPPPTAAPVVAGPQRVSGGVGWRWPARGPLLNTFAPGDPGRQGIDIRGQPGQLVLAAADGEVVYSGSGLIGYGELIIIKHSNEFLSAYGHNRKRLVAEGGKVVAGQPIAEMGRSGSGIDLLHFEIRRRGKPVNPLLHLPGR